MGLERGGVKGWSWGVGLVGDVRGVGVEMVRGLGARVLVVRYLGLMGWDWRDESERGGVKL